MFEFELPDVGEGVAEGEIVAWHAAPGDDVEEDQLLAEVETDKAVVDLPSPVAGTVRERHAEAGDIVPVGNVVITIDHEDENEDKGEGTDDGRADGTATEERVFAPPNVRRLARELGVDLVAVDGSGHGGRATEGDVRAAAETGSEASDRETDGTGAEASDRGIDGTGAEASDRGTDGTGAEASSGREPERTVGDADSGDGEGTPGMRAADRDRTLAAPATRGIAREEGVDIDEVPTERTRNGEAFVEPEDVRAYAEAREAAEAGGGAGTADGAETGREQAVTREPYRGIRRTIGQQMEESAFTVPHACHHDTAVVGDLVTARAELKPRAEKRGVGLTYVPFVLKAVVAGLEEHPVLNSELDKSAEEILYKSDYNLGLAVATEAGLIVPVVESVDEKGLLELAAEVDSLAERARDRELEPEETRGGTFTVTNFGAVGGEYATPIINYPETAILGLGAIEPRPVVEESETTASSRSASNGAASTGQVVARHTLPLSLSIDHRVIDGAEAAGFVNTVIEYLENPTLLLLE
jgi:Pyruvate/2-oxoglutarate dehydrogenase complex, dihydrolipoamide acyltransferase (E2) component, and related enzymes